MGEKKLILLYHSPLYLIFFTLVGASLELFSLKELGILGGVYFLTRPLGEWIGAYIGAVISRTSRLVRNYIGFSLVPFLYSSINQFRIPMGTEE